MKDEQLALLIHTWEIPGLSSASHSEVSFFLSLWGKTEVIPQPSEFIMDNNFLILPYVL